MRNTIGIALVTAAAILLLELLLQTPLYRWLQPAILTPAEGTVVSLPLQVQWDGPSRLRVRLLTEGGPARDLGIHRSPFELTAKDLPEPGAYRLQARALFLGGLIQTERRFAVAAAPTAAAPAPPQRADPKLAEVSQSLADLKAAHERTMAENAGLYEENASLRQDNARLMEENERLAKANEEATTGAAAQEASQEQLQQQNRALSEQLTMLQWQLNAALTCTVWGYYAYPHPQTIPPTRRTVTVTDPQGNVFRTQPDCNVVRQQDPTAASRCFCVGTPWTGG
jgi:hypothetical protein